MSASSVTVGARSVAGVGTATREDVAALGARYGTLARARWAFDEHAADLLAELADRGRLPDDGVAALGIDELLRADEYRTAVEGTQVTVVRREGEAVAHLATTVRTDDHDVTVAVQPGPDRSFAVVNDRDGGSVRVVPADGGDFETLADCEYETRCDGACCDDDCTELYYVLYHCCVSDGTGQTADCVRVDVLGCCGAPFEQAIDVTAEGRNSQRRRERL